MTGKTRFQGKKDVMRMWQSFFYYHSFIYSEGSKDVMEFMKGKKRRSCPLTTNVQLSGSKRVRAKNNKIKV